MFAFRKKFASLQYKVMLLLSVCLTVAFGSLIVVKNGSDIETANRLTDEINRNQIRMISRQSAIGLETKDAEALEAFIYDFINSNENEGAAAMVDVTVLTADGAILKRHQSFDRPAFSEEAFLGLALRSQRTGKIERWQDHNIVVLAAPVFAHQSLAGADAPIGSVAVAWDTSGIQRSLQLTAGTNAVIAFLAACAIVILLSIGIHRLILRPLRELVQIMANEHGDVPGDMARRRDEIGVLARGFAQLMRITRARSEEQIALRNMQLDAALSNMSQGLMMFGPDKCLILGNSRFQEFYGIPDELMVPGTPIEHILTRAYAEGNYEGKTLEWVFENRTCRDRNMVEHNFEEVIRGGRYVSVRKRRSPERNWIITYTDVTEQKRDEARIEHMALHDSLTGLPNRVKFRTELDRALERAKRGKTQAVFCLDLDHFKLVNDTLGHPIGDQLLRDVADRLRKCLRQGDLVARLGGDEFAILRDDVNGDEDPSKLAKRIVETLSAPYQLSGHTVVIGASVGIALAPADGTDADRLMKSADLALYRAKALGRGTYSYFEKEMDARAQERRVLELELRRALENKQFEVRYQPIIDLEQDRVTCLEALLRWHHPERGLVAPDGFIPLAEEIGILGQIGAWVLMRACQDAAGWPDGIRVAVNLSPSQMRSRSLIVEVDAALDSSGLEPGRLELEITESVLIQDTESTLKVLEALRAMGVRISMDDFGTGYSSLSYLRKFPFDKIKVDRSFLTDVGNGEDGLAIIRAVTGLGGSLGIATCAEGVETLEQLDLVRREGCDEAQGFYYSAAIPGAEINALLATLANRNRSTAYGGLPINGTLLKRPG